MRKHFITILFPSCTILVAGWSGDAHRVIADIAHFNTQSATKDHLVKLTGTSNYDELREWMKSESTWADDMDHLYPLRGQNPKYHFVHTSTSCGPYDEKNDCGDNDDPGVCLVSGILRHIQILVSPKYSPSTQLDSFRYLVHFLADVHQPLHVGFRADRGGNNIKDVLPYNENLHNIWDNWLVQEDMASSNAKNWFGYGGYSATLGRAIDYAVKLATEANIQQYDLNKRDDIHSFIVSLVEQTSSQFTCSVSYPLNSVAMVGNGTLLDTAYIQGGANAVSTQIKRAGVRLGKLLDAIVVNYAENKAELERIQAEKEAMKLEEQRLRDIATAERRAEKAARQIQERAARKILEAEQRRERLERNAMGMEDQAARMIEDEERAAIAARRVQITARAKEAALLSKEWARRKREAEKADKKAAKNQAKLNEAVAREPELVDDVNSAQQERKQKATRVVTKTRGAAAAKKETKPKSSTVAKNGAENVDATAVREVFASTPRVATTSLNRIKY